MKIFFRKAIILLGIGWLPFSSILSASEALELFLKNSKPEIASIDSVAMEIGTYILPDTRLNLEGTFKVEGTELRSLTLSSGRAWILSKPSMIREEVLIKSSVLVLKQLLTWGGKMEVGDGGGHSILTALGESPKGKGKSLKISSNSFIIVILGYDQEGTNKNLPFFELTDDFECEAGATLLVMKAKTMESIRPGRYPIVRGQKLKGPDITLMSQEIGQEMGAFAQVLDKNEINKCSLEKADGTIYLVVSQ